jgi:ATP-dependent DNA helicase DinG
MHRRALESNIIIVNHHLFFADLAVRDDAFQGILPKYSAVIFDEAHEIEDVAGQYFGSSISNLQFQELIRDTSAISRRKFFSTPELDRTLIVLGDRAESFFSLFPQEGRQAYRDQRAFLVRNEPLYRELIFSLALLSNHLLEVDDALEDTVALVRRARLMQQALEFWMESGDRTFVYWTERRGRGLYLQATPIDVSSVLEERLHDKVDCVVLTSATLTVAGSFEYTESRLGLKNARSLHVESQYDFSTQALFYVPPHLPDPRERDAAYYIAEEIERILNASRGRAFVLFTSLLQMRSMHQMLAGRLPFPSLLQGTAPKTALIDQFRVTPNAVLFATSSFWQGVDVQGEALSCVIIDKLPFAVPTDPVIQARADAIRDAGGNPFYDYQIPQAALALKQGFGRLIRSQNDRGVLVLLDNRITKLRYGRVFFDSLPAYRFTNKFKEVEDFFNV